jgi:putative spermidine/putrescine transport system substrate-binding protein
VQLATAAQVLAMIEAGRIAIDVLDLDNLQLIALSKRDTLAPIDYDGMKLTNPGDIKPSVRHPNLVGNLYYATVLVYNTDVFKAGEHPKSWKDFWNVAAFPGARTLADQRSGAAELEFALLADGVPRDHLYPIDMGRAFASLGRIKPYVPKWWDTGALSAQLLERKEAVAGGLWNGRAQDLIDKGVPLAIEWNEAKQQLQAWAVVKGSPNAANAQRFIDFALQPRIQAELTRHIAYGPTNDQAFKYVRPEDLAKLPSAPENYKDSFEQNAMWWSDNLVAVGERWQSWVLSKG